MGAWVDLSFVCLRSGGGGRPHRTQAAQPSLAHRSLDHPRTRRLACLRGKWPAKVPLPMPTSSSPSPDRQSTSAVEPAAASAAGAGRGGGWQVVHWHVEAPPQPALGAPCNGCGLCCLAQPCPLGMWVSRRRQGACVALRFSEAQGRYLCGMVADPGEVTGWRSATLNRWVQSLARRWIAVGAGCDADPLLPGREQAPGHR